MDIKFKRLEYFEQEIAKFIGTEYAIVTGSGRAALKIALRSLEIDGGNVLISNLTCAIIPQTVISAGFRPSFVDINEDLSLNLKPIMSNFDKENKAIIVNYLYGCPTDDIDGILDFAKGRHLWVIEDAAQSFGAKVKGKQVGSFGDMGIFSFPKCFFRLFRGGAITTNDKKLADNARKHREQIQGGPDTLSILFRYFRMATPNLMKRLYGSLQRKATPEDLIPCYSPNGLYEYQETTYPYQFQNLTDFEIRSAIHTLHNLKKLMAVRASVVGGMLRIIHDKTELDMPGVFPYQPDFVYTRIPVIIKHPTLSQWITYFQRKDIGIDMYYRPLSDNILLRDKSVLSCDYAMSRKLATNLLPLPINSKLRGVLEDFTRKEIYV